MVHKHLLALAAAGSVAASGLRPGNAGAECQRLPVTTDRALAARVDAIIAQGLEAGGHRGSYLRDPYEALTGTLALTRMIVRAVSVPVVAAVNGPAVGLGCMSMSGLYGKGDDNESIAAIHYALDQGINLLDTADVYGERGRSEEYLGRALKGRRHQVLVATKFGNRMGPGPNEVGLSRLHIVKAVEDSLRRLQTDHIDLYQPHSWDPETPLEETLRALEDIVRQGKVRYLGCSNFPAWHLAMSLGISSAKGWSRFDCVQPRYNLLYREIESELLPLCRDQGLGVIAYNPLAGGLLTGKHKPDAVPTDGTRFTKDMYRQRYWNQHMFEAVDELTQVAREADMTLIELSFRWLLSRPLVDCMLLGASSMQQLEMNLVALGGPEPDEDTVRRCDDVWARLHGPAPNYNR